jgi:hypothetical protein
VQFGLKHLNMYEQFEKQILNNLHGQKQIYEQQMEQKETNQTNFHPVPSQLYTDRTQSTTVPESATSSYTSNDSTPSHTPTRKRKQSLLFDPTPTRISTPPSFQFSALESLLVEPIPTDRSQCLSHLKSYISILLLESRVHSVFLPFIDLSYLSNQHENEIIKHCFEVVQKCNAVTGIHSKQYIINLIDLQ